MIRTFSEIPSNQRHRVAAVPGGEDQNTLLALESCRVSDNLTSLLIGNPERIMRTLRELSFDPAHYRVLDSRGNEAMTREALRACDRGEADILVKGMVNSPSFLAAILAHNKEKGHNTLINQVWIFENIRSGKLLVLSDGALIIAPDLSEKVKIIANCVAFCRAMGISEPKVAVLAPLEKVNPRIPSTVDAACLSVMNQRGQIPNCLVEGPLALDNAISPEAMELKSIQGKFNGHPDILIVPDLDAGNILGKSLVYFAGFRTASLLWGSAYPTALPSRSGTPDSKASSIRFALYVANQKQEGESLG
ncbi:MAG TPA: phosphate acyltransferase [Atribacteraceae bacterium]|nr:phosphate acyltransferase [Atribacteraceae bacterium]